MRKLQNLILLFITLVGASGFAQAQTGKISGTVIDGNTKTIASATITLVRAADSSMAKMSVADKTGKFEFDKIAFGKYLVSISAVGHQPAFSSLIDLNEANSSIEIKTIELVPVSKSLSAVTVTAKKPAIEVKPGKMVVNVDASPTNAGLNVLELLEKAPGVAVDNDGNISLKGKQGVTILIDGKPTYLSGPDLAALLKSMQSSNLDQLEIMSNPPAKYDAAGNSGIINIKTKKSIIKGMNGNANAGYTQGIYARWNTGVNLNYRNNKVNVFGGYNLGQWQNYNRIIISRRFYDNGVLDGSSDQISKQANIGFYHNIKAGVDYTISKKDVLGMVVNANFSNNDEGPKSTSNLRDEAGNINGILRSWSDNERKFKSFTTNFNYKHTFDSTGREISADADFAQYTSRNNTLLTTKTFDENDIDKLRDVSLRGIIPSDISIYSAKVDYVQPFKSGMKLETGLKTSIVKTDNKVDYLRNSGTGWTADDRSNHFIYDENINAAYAILSRSIKKWELIAGLRLENTVSKGHQVRNDSISKRNYTNLFPNLGVGYNANENNQFNFSYSRRVRRPDYESLNPFVYFLDSLTYGQGNPYLQPQFSNNFELTHTFHRFFTTVLNYSKTTDIITELLKQDTEKKVTYQTKENFSQMQQWGLAVMANFNAAKWWSMNVYANAFNNHYEGLYDAVPVDIKFTSFGLNMTNSFSFGKGWNGEVSGWYRSRGAEGLLIANDMWAVSSAVTKSVLKKKGTVKLGIRDIFFTQQFSGYARYADVDVDIMSRRDTRQVNLSFTYRFGKTNIAPARRKTGGAEDEQQRAGGSGN